MKLNQSTRLADLMYGHGDKYMQCLSGKLEPSKFPDSPAIQVCELKCGCWVYVASASKGVDAKRLLGAKIKRAEHKKGITLILHPLTPMEGHRCQ